MTLLKKHEYHELNEWSTNCTRVSVNMLTHVYTLLYN